MNIIGEHTKAAIRDGGQLLLKQAIRNKWIFNAQITFTNGDGTLGDISLSEEGALENLESALAMNAAKEGA